MKLKVYLAENDMMIKDFSKIVGCNPHYMGQIIKGHLKPGKRLAKDIAAATNGKVIILDPESEPVEEVQKTG